MRVRFLPEVFAARGSAPLPPDQRRRPRETWSLMALGVFVSLTAGVGLCAVGYGLLAIGLAVLGPRDQVLSALIASVGCTIVAIVAPRGRVWLVRWWMRREFGEDDAEGHRRRG